MEISKSNQLKDFALKHPVVIYYFTTFLISWGGLVLVLGGLDRVTAEPTTTPFLPLYFITVAGPAISGVVLTGIYGGTKGYRDFLLRLFKWRVSGRWYAAALLIAPFTVFTTLFILYLFSPVFLPGILSHGNNPVASAFGLPGSNKITSSLLVLVISLFNGFVEEIGWTGFATPWLRTRYTVFAAGLNLGLTWGLWHLLSNCIGSADGAGTLPLPFYVAVLLFSFLPPFRIIMMWVYDHTKSLFIGILMHASLDLFWILGMPNVLTGQQRGTWYLVWAVVLWSIVALIRITGNRRSPTPP